MTVARFYGIKKAEPYGRNTMRKLRGIIAELAEAQVSLSQALHRRAGAKIDRAIEFSTRELGMHKRDVHRADLAYVPPLSQKWEEQEAVFEVEMVNIETKIADLTPEPIEVEDLEPAG